MTDWVPEPHTYSVLHRSTYSYSATVGDAYSVLNLLPRSTAWQEILDSRIETDPAADEYDERFDAFGNRVVQLGLHGAHDRFDVTSQSLVRVHPVSVPACDLTWREVAALNAIASGSDALEIGPYLALTPSVTPIVGGGVLDGMFDLDFAPGRTLVDVARAVSARIHNSFVFDPLATDVSTPLDDLIAVSRGVCQDFAHLAISVFRRRGLAARYVSGYIETDPPPGEPKSIGADASHAWCSIWLPGCGWVDLDPTNDQLPITRHITVAWGRDYRDVAPVRGVVIGPTAGQTLDVAVDVRRVD